MTESLSTLNCLRADRADVHEPHPFSAADETEYQCPGYDGHLPVRFSQEIRRAFASMPYAADLRVMKGNISMGSYRDPLREDEVIDALNALSEVLREHGHEVADMTTKYDHLRSDVAAMRRVLGIGEEG